MKTFIKTLFAATLLSSAAVQAAPFSFLSAGNDTPQTAPEFTGIEKWLNSEPLSMQKLRGKVVLVDFWTYTCINCVRTLPYVKSWHDKYKDQGLVVVGVHTPEYPFERSTEKVTTALKRFDIRYPVAQDNNYATWNAYSNRYWPAMYLVDKKGRIVYTHFGEGNYQETEAKIRSLLAQPE